MEIVNQPNKELKVMIVKMIKEFKRKKKKNSGEWTEVRSFKQRVRKYKEQPNRDKKYNTWSEKNTFSLKEPTD